MTSLSSYGARALPAGGNADWVHARFDRAVDIVQSLPRSGPIQTNYDDKLLLYSVYKQATEGDIKASRPGLLDVLGRAKWDAWNKRKGLSTEEAERLYVQGLLKILKGYSDRTQAVELIRELETFSLDPRAMVMSGSIAPSTSSSSTEGDTPQPLASSSHSHRRRQQPPVAGSHRGLGQRARPAHSTTSASVAPSLPGYGPPRTRADSPRRGGGSSTDGSGSEDYSSAEEEQRSRRAYGQQPLTPQQYPYGQHSHHSQQHQHSSQQLHPPAPSMPNRVLSPPLHPSQYPQHPHLQQLQQQQQQHQAFPPSPQQSFRGAPSPAPGLGAAPSIGQQVAVAYAPGMQRPPSLQPLQRPPSQAQGPPPGLDAALDRIQTSLTALHERLAELERSRLSASTSLSLSTSNPDSPLSLLRQSFLRLLVILHLRKPSAQVVQLGLGKLLLRLLASIVRVGRRVMGDLGVALVVLGLLARISGRGQGVGMAELAGRLVGMIQLVGARKGEKRLARN